VLTNLTVLHPYLPDSKLASVSEATDTRCVPCLMTRCCAGATDLAGSGTRDTGRSGPTDGAAEQRRPSAGNPVFRKSRLVSYSPARLFTEPGVPYP